MATPSRRLRFTDRLGTPGWVLLTALLLGLSYPPFPFYGLALVAFVPLLARWSRMPTPWMLFREAYAAFLIVAALSGYWMLLDTDALKALLAGVSLLALPIPYAAAVSASSLAARRLGIVTGAIALVAGWLAVEFALTRGPLAAPWLLLGQTQANALLFNQFADLGGTAGLGLWVWLVNGAVFLFLRASTLTVRFALSLVLALIMLSPVGYRGWRLADAEPGSGTIRVAIAQPASPPHEWAEIARIDRVEHLAALSDEALRGIASPAATAGGLRPELVIWPEAAIPVFPDARLQGVLYDRLSGWASQRGVALLTGAVTRYDTAPDLTVEPVIAQQLARTYPYYNSALLFRGRRPPQQYDKVLRTLATDRVPSVGMAEGEVLGALRSFGPGAERTVFSAPGAPFSTLIGYEVWFGDHARHMVAGGATYLTLLSNTGWWGYSPAMAQQEAAARLRAIETRRAVVSASVVGGSGVILPDGSRAETAGWMERRVLTVSVPVHHAITPYVRHGDVVYHAALMALGLISVAWGLALGFFSAPGGGGVKNRRSRRRGTAPPASA